jgi:acyl-CoA thioesterase II
LYQNAAMTDRFTDLMTAHRVGDDDFRAEPAGRGFLFGGLTMGMAVTAAAATVDDEMTPMSLRCHFLSFGEWGPTDVSVARLSTRRSFAHRRVDLQQGSRNLVAAADLVFHRLESGPDRHHVPPARVTGPEDLQTVDVVFGSKERVDPFELRPVHSRPDGYTDRFHPFWARTREPLERAALHYAALTFMSDYLVIRSPFEPEAGQSEGLRSFTLEHSLWFHRSFDASDWMLFDCVPVSESNGRYVSEGTVHDERGSLLASFVQVGFIRPGDPAGPAPATGAPRASGVGRTDSDA